MESISSLDDLFSLVFMVSLVVCFGLGALKGGQH